ncbi:MAG: DUF1116 domain-containing protein [Qingshengfaniella sp.]
MSFWDGIAPRLTACLPLADAVPAVSGRMLLHAGPPFATPSACPRPMLNAAIAAALAEGWCHTPAEAETAVTSGALPLHPAQDYGVVTPLACVVSPTMPVLRVEAAGITALSPVNDGPTTGALRFGLSDPAAQVARIAEMAALAPVLSAALATGEIPLLPLMASAIEQGDDLHGSVAAMTALLADRLALQGAADPYVRGPLFALNPVMAAAAAMLKAGARAAPEPMVIAAGSNGVTFGWICSDAPDRWQTAPAQPPMGPRMDDGTAPVLPAIGDSAVIDALGLGGPILRYAQPLRAALSPFHDPAVFAPSETFLAAHPGLPSDISLGCAVRRMGAHPGVMLAMLGAGGEGLIGRGLAPWPQT